MFALLLGSKLLNLFLGGLRGFLSGAETSFLPEMGKSFIWMFGSVGGLIPSWGDGLLKGITNLGESVSLQLESFGAGIKMDGLITTIGSFFTDTLPM